MPVRRKALAAASVLVMGALLAAVTSRELTVADTRMFSVADLADLAYLADAPRHDVAIVLSCAPGPLLAKRMDAACALVQRGLVGKLVLSGMPLEMPYMRERAIACGAALLVDDGAVRTLENLRRARDRFAVRRALVVTQRFHLSRALYLADALGMEATGVIALGHPSSLSGRMRERIARMKARLDVALLNEGPS